MLGTCLDNEPWEFGCVPANQIESSRNKRHQIKWQPGIYVTDKSDGDGFYEVVVHPLYLPWLSDHGFELNLNYNPTKPRDKKKSAYGTEEATRRACDYFLNNAVTVIHSGCGPGLEKCYRDVALKYGLEIPLERAILSYDILVSFFLVGFHSSLTLVRNLKTEFASVLCNYLCSLV